MQNIVISLKERHMEQSVVHIGAKIADAIAMARKARELSEISEDKLIEAQLELEELFMRIRQEPC